MAEIEIIDLTPGNISDYGVCGYKAIEKHEGLRNKIDWFKKYYKKGLRIKALVSQEGECQGTIEYLPGKYAHRPVDADRYMFIQCVFSGYQKEFKGKGYGSRLIDECLKDARIGRFQGVAVVTRKGPFMVHNSIFLKKGFRIVEAMDPDFELLALKFEEGAEDPKFRKIAVNEEKYGKGLTILRSAQCPYSVKNVDAILETAKKKMKMRAELIDLKNAISVQNVPCGFGTFCIIHDGEIVSHHPISRTRFENIMKNRSRDSRPPKDSIRRSVRR
jgi:hypothetical protein